MQLLPFFSFSQARKANETTVNLQNQRLHLSNNSLDLVIDLEKGTYSITDKIDNLIVFENARLSADGWNSPHIYGPTQIGKQKIAWAQVNVNKLRESGKRVELYFTGSTKIIPQYIFAFTLMDGDAWVSLQAGLKNTMPNDCRFMKAELFSNARIFPGASITSLKTLNGAAGVTKPEVIDSVTRESTNSMLLTAIVNGKRHSIVWGGLHYQYYYASTMYKKEDATIHLFMNDPVGRLIKVDETWWAPDTYYLGLGENNPFLALEQYGLALREANNAHPNVYDFPTLCGWAVGNLSGGKDINNAVSLVQEMDEANKCGLTKYTKVAVRLEPDTYCYQDGNTEQGWWDDAHWSRFGHLNPPYETFAKWCAAVKERNGIPFTYFQSGMPSDDFARAHPSWMLYNDISKIHLYHRHHQPFVRYDYTDKEFKQYTLAMWKRLRKDGMVGIKFDYPETAWNSGGFEDSLATTTSAYRQMFQLCREGLGPDARIHERALGESDRPTLDVTAGIVDIQRTAWDNNSFTPDFVTTDGLRWYKARSVFLYYPDSKAIHPHNAEIRQSLLTMIALTSGRLELATPFEMLTSEMVHDISRIYPMYHGLKSPRPLDAFIGIKDPRVYDLELTPNWHELALFNSGNEKALINVSLSKPMVEAGLALDSAANYYVYNFGKDSFVGRIKGTATIGAELNSLACALFSIKKVEPIPQILSTNRHIFQGWMDTEDVQWNDRQKSLSGKALVVAGEPFKIVIATNFWKHVGVRSNSGTIRLEDYPAENSLKVLIMENTTSQAVEWNITFKK
jgi:hypothetical protein